MWGQKISEVNEVFWEFWKKGSLLLLRSWGQMRSIRIFENFEKGSLLLLRSWGQIRSWGQWSFENLNFEKVSLFTVEDRWGHFEGLEVISSSYVKSWVIWAGGHLRSKEDNLEVIKMFLFIPFSLWQSFEVKLGKIPEFE